MAQNTNRKAYSNKGKGKANYSKKYGPTPEEDAAVKAFFAESPKREKQKAGEQSYQAADHETPRATMENPLPEGNKGLAGSRFFVAPAVKEESNLLPPGEKGLANSRFATPEVAEEDSKA
ncbi:hypothetical protein N0V85_009691 [Neurospora sp. IMI 360204]|nr:hypothetical protein N0V85_009691 [Neurospora sp. IMI 360204]